MLLNEAFKRDVVFHYSGDDRVTITGREITGTSKESADQMLEHVSYPLRFRLNYLQRAVVRTLRQMGRPITNNDKGELRPFDAMIQAAVILRSELKTVMEEIEDDGFTPLDERLGINSNWREWVVDSDPQDIFECIYQSSELLQPNSGWTYGDICGVLSLWCIDECVARIEADEPYKAAIWAGYAGRYYEWQTSFSYLDTSGDSEQRSPGVRIVGKLPKSA